MNKAIDLKVIFNNQHTPLNALTRLVCGLFTKLQFEIAYWDFEWTEYACMKYALNFKSIASKMFILTEKQQFDQYHGVRKDISLTSMLCRKWIGNNIYTELWNMFFHPWPSFKGI